MCVYGYMGELNHRQHRERAYVMDPVADGLSHSPTQILTHADSQLLSHSRSQILAHPHICCSQRVNTGGLQIVRARA